MTKEEIKNAWLEINFEPSKTDREGFITFQELPDDFDLWLLDTKNSPYKKNKERITYVRPKSLRKEKVTFIQKVIKLFTKKPLK